MRTRMAEVDDQQATAATAVQPAAAGPTDQRAETLDHLQRLSIEAAVARIEATVARTEANVVHLNRGVSETRAISTGKCDRSSKASMPLSKRPAASSATWCK